MAPAAGSAQGQALRTRGGAQEEGGDRSRGDRGASEATTATQAAEAGAGGPDGPTQEAEAAGMRDAAQWEATEKATAGDRNRGPRGASEGGTSGAGG